MSTIVELSIFPIGKGEGLSPYVARVLKVIKESGLPYQLGPMGTSIEGELEEVMALVLRCIEELKKDCSRIYWTIKGDYREGLENRLNQKVESVKIKINNT